MKDANGESLLVPCRFEKAGEMQRGVDELILTFSSLYDCRVANTGN
jgi:hypothetical protein